MVGSVEPEQFARLVATRSVDNDPVSSLCLACTDVLGVTGVGLMLVSGERSLGCVGVSDPMTEAVEEIEYTAGAGPCLTAYRSKTPMFDPQLADEEGRWPEFRDGATAAGVRAAFGFPLLVDRFCIGALNLYRDRPGPLTYEQVRDALVIASWAGSTLLAWQADAPPGGVAWQLEELPSHRMEVHQATGRIAVQARVTVPDALALLRAYAFSHDRPITEVAAAVSSGALRFD